MRTVSNPFLSVVVGIFALAIALIAATGSNAQGGEVTADQAAARFKEAYRRYREAEIDYARARERENEALKEYGRAKEREKALRDEYGAAVKKARQRAKELPEGELELLAPELAEVERLRKATEEAIKASKEKLDPLQKLSDTEWEAWSKYSAARDAKEAAWQDLQTAEKAGGPKAESVLEQAKLLTDEALLGDDSGISEVILGGPPEKRGVTKPPEAPADPALGQEKRTEEEKGREAAEGTTKPPGTELAESIRGSGGSLSGRQEPDLSGSWRVESKAFLGGVIVDIQQRGDHLILTSTSLSRDFKDTREKLPAAIRKHSRWHPHVFRGGYVGRRFDLINHLGPDDLCSIVAGCNVAEIARNYATMMGEPFEKVEVTVHEPDRIKLRLWRRKTESRIEGGRCCRFYFADTWHELGSWTAERAARQSVERGPQR